MKRVWILNHYAGQMFMEKGMRHYWIAKFLKQAGYEPLVICSNAKHNSKSELYFDFEGLSHSETAEEIGVPFEFIAGRAYTYNDRARILNMIDFCRNLLKCAGKLAEKYGKPDIIYASSFHPLTLLSGIRLAKHFKIKCICEIRDLWPETLIAYSYMGKNNIMVKILRLLEKYIYKKTDSLVFTMEGAYDYIVERGWQNVVSKDKVYYVNNGVDLEMFDSNKQQFTISDPDLENPDIFKIVYVGSIRKVNNLDKLLDIAKSINNQKIRFLMWGYGDQLERLKNRVEKEKINNVVFKGKVDKKYIAYITSHADLNLVHNDSSPIFRFGISFNKLFECLAAGCPVLCDFDSKYNPVVTYGAGENVPSGDIFEIANKIDEISQYSKEKLSAMSQDARRAVKNYDFCSLTKKIAEIIEITQKGVKHL